ncbi:unnamed protein product [Leptidea sinapis]|uniref:Glycolipid transfer protein domain-containing protein n=1 Tax=Leptidea sinapis TaxID=189913 RepID=A0A5E4Q5E1_9NEOP|nr:unnamed protein product [Leptidea sinapis]
MDFYLLLKIQSILDYNNDSCLIELLVMEKLRGKSVAVDATLWLNRALLFFELVFQEILNETKLKNNDINMKRIFNSAYKGSVKQYHSWTIQQLFSVICKLSPSYTQILKSFGSENDLEAFEAHLSKFNSTLHQVRSKIDEFFVDNNSM